MTPAQGLLTDLTFSMVMSWKKGVRRCDGCGGYFAFGERLGVVRADEDGGLTSSMVMSLKEML